MTQIICIIDHENKKWRLKMKRLNRKGNGYNLLLLISSMVAIAQILLIINFFVIIIPLQRLQGLPLFLTWVSAPIGGILASISVNKSNKKTFSIVVLCVHIALLFTISAYYVIGTLVYGV